MKKIIVVIVSYNSANELKRCIDSVRVNSHDAKLKETIVVIDNCSSDLSVKVAKSGGALVIKNSKNLGFASAVNQGLRLGLEGELSDYFLILNPDTQMKKNSLVSMVNCFTKNIEAGRLGAVGPKMLNDNGESTNDGYYMKAPSLLTVTLFYTLLRRRFVNKPFFVDRCYQEPKLNSSRLVQQIPGACLLTDYDAIRDIGLLDEDFAIWYEDVEWSYRARRKGFNLWYCAEAEVMHTGGVSFEKWQSLEKTVTFYVSMKAFFKKSKPLSYVPVLIVLTLNSLILYAKTRDKSNLVFIRKVLKQKRGVLPS